MKKKKSEYIGIGCDVFHFEENVTQEEIELLNEKAELQRRLDEIGDLAKGE